MKKGRFLKGIGKWVYICFVKIVAFWKGFKYNFHMFSLNRSFFPRFFRCNSCLRLIQWSKFQGRLLMITTSFHLGKNRKEIMKKKSNSFDIYKDTFIFIYFKDFLNTSSSTVFIYLSSYTFQNFFSENEKIQPIS